MNLRDTIETLRRHLWLELVVVGVSVVMAMAVLAVDPLFILAALIALAGVALVLAKPYYGVLFYLILLYVRPGDLLPALAPLRLTLLGVALVTGAFVLQALVYRRFKPIFTVPMAFMLLSFVAIGLSLPDSFYRTITMTRFTDIARVVFMTFLIVQLVDSAPRLRGFMTTLSLIMIGLSTALVLRFVLMPETHLPNGGSGGIIGGFLGDGNDFALAQNVILPWTFMLIGVTRAKWLKGLFIYGVVIGAIAVGCSFSRGGFLGLLTVFGAMYLFWMIRRRKYAIGLFIAIIALVAATFAFLALVPDEFLDRISSIKDYEEDESALGRLDAWGAGARMFADNPFVGVGAGAFAVAYGTKYKPPDAIAANWREAHSVYVQVMGEMGLVGIISFFGMVIAILLQIIRLKRTRLTRAEDDRFFHAMRGAVYGSLATWAVSAAFLSVAYYPHVFILVMVSACMERLARYHAVKPPTMRTTQRTGHART